MARTSTNMYDRCADSVCGLFTKVDSLVYNLNNNKPKKCLCWAVIILFWFSILLILNFLTPLIADDFCYLFIYNRPELINEKISGLGDILQSQVNHYYLWGGRSVVHFIAQALLLLPSFVIDLLNTIMYMVYVYLIYMMIKGRGKHSLSLFLLINLAVWLIQPAYGDTILWVTGSANYLWGTTMVLAFLLPYRLYDGPLNESRLQSGIKAILFFLYGILAGWTNENTAAAMLIISLVYIISYSANKYKMPMWAIGGFIGAIIGYSVMI